MNVERKYEYLREDIGALYEEYRKRCNLPSVESPEEQVKILDERKIIRLKKQIEDPHESLTAIKTRIECILDTMM